MTHLSVYDSPECLWLTWVSMTHLSVYDSPHLSVYDSPECLWLTSSECLWLIWPSMTHLSVYDSPECLWLTWVSMTHLSVYDSPHLSVYDSPECLYHACRPSAYWTRPPPDWDLSASTDTSHSRSSSALPPSAGDLGRDHVWRPEPVCQAGSKPDVPSHTDHRTSHWHHNWLSLTTQHSSVLHHSQVFNHTHRRLTSTTFTALGLESLASQTWKMLEWPTMA